MSQPPPGAAQAGPLSSPDPWNLVAEGYEAVAREFLEKYSRSGLAMLDYDAETRVLDVACGPGTTSLLLSPHVESVTCVDFSASMLDTLRRKSVAAGAQNLEILEADGQALPFEDGSFDLAVSMFGLAFFPDRDKGFAELHRVLVPGGQALVSELGPPTSRRSWVSSSAPCSRTTRRRSRRVCPAWTIARYSRPRCAAPDLRTSTSNR